MIRILVVNDIDLHSVSKLAECALRRDSNDTDSSVPNLGDGNIDLCFAFFHNSNDKDFSNEHQRQQIISRKTKRKRKKKKNKITPEEEAALDGLRTCVINQLETIVCRVVYHYTNFITNSTNTTIKRLTANSHNIISSHDNETNHHTSFLQLLPGLNCFGHYHNFTSCCSSKCNGISDNECIDINQQSIMVTSLIHGDDDGDDDGHNIDTTINTEALYSSRRRRDKRDHYHLYHEKLIQQDDNEEKKYNREENHDDGILGKSSNSNNNKSQIVDKYINCFTASTCFTKEAEDVKRGVILNILTSSMDSSVTSSSYCGGNKKTDDNICFVMPGSLRKHGQFSIIELLWEKSTRQDREENENENVHHVTNVNDEREDNKEDNNNREKENLHFDSMHHRWKVHDVKFYNM